MHVDIVPLTGMINKIIGLRSLQFYQEREHDHNTTEWNTGCECLQNSTDQSISE